MGFWHIVLTWFLEYHLWYMPALWCLEFDKTCRNCHKQSRSRSPADDANHDHDHNHQLTSVKPITSITLTVKSLWEARGGFWKVSQRSVRPNLRSASRKMPVPPLKPDFINDLSFNLSISYPPPTVTMVESPDMKSSLALRFFSSSSSSSESGCTHGKCSTPDFVNLRKIVILIIAISCTNLS